MSIHVAFLPYFPVALSMHVVLVGVVVADDEKEQDGARKCNGNTGGVR